MSLQINADQEERSVTWKDIQLIMPTVCILIFTLLVISTVIPYAFSTAINQLRALQAREAAEEAVRSQLAQIQGGPENTLIKEQQTQETQGSQEIQENQENNEDVTSTVSPANPVILTAQIPTEISV